MATVVLVHPLLEIDDRDDRAERGVCAEEIVLPWRLADGDRDDADGAGAFHSVHVATQSAKLFLLLVKLRFHFRRDLGPAVVGLARLRNGDHVVGFGFAQFGGRLRLTRHGQYSRLTVWALASWRLCPLTICEGYSRCDRNLRRDGAGAMFRGHCLIGRPSRSQRMAPPAARASTGKPSPCGTLRDGETAPGVIGFNHWPRQLARLFQVRWGNLLGAHWPRLGSASVAAKPRGNLARGGPGHD